MPYLRDESQEVARAYGARTTPDVFVFGPDGAVAYRGAPDADHGDPGLGRRLAAGGARRRARRPAGRPTRDRRRWAARSSGTKPEMATLELDDATLFYEPVRRRAGHRLARRGRPSGRQLAPLADTGLRAAATATRPTTRAASAARARAPTSRRGRSSPRPRRRGADRGRVHAAGGPDRPVDGLADRGAGGRLRPPRARALRGSSWAPACARPASSGSGRRRRSSCAAPAPRCRRTSPTAHYALLYYPAEVLGDDALWAELRSLHRLRLQDRDGAMLAAQWQACLEYDSSALLPHFDVPIHASAFAQDVQTPPQRVREVADAGRARALPRARGLRARLGLRPPPGQVNACLRGIVDGYAPRSSPSRSR